MTDLSPERIRELATRVALAEARLGATHMLDTAAWARVRNEPEFASVDIHRDPKASAAVKQIAALARTAVVTIAIPEGP